MASWWLGWMLLIPFLMDTAKLCEIPDGNDRLIRSLNMKLLRASQDVAENMNPSIQVGLRLSKDHSLEKEIQYLQRLEAAFQPRESSSDVEPQAKGSTGQLALYILALRASCKDMNTKEGKWLITHLKHHLHKEKENIGAAPQQAPHDDSSRRSRPSGPVTDEKGDHLSSKGNPVSSYYQYSLGVLALCVNYKKVDVHVVNKLLQAEGQNKFTLEGGMSVDMEAVAGLAFLCLERSDLYTPDVIEKLREATESIKAKILQSQGDNGAFGNIYSTALAVQFLAASGAGVSDSTCSKGVSILIDSLKQGYFSNPMMMSQLMPVLHQRTYLDIATMDCKNEMDTLILRSVSTGSRGTSLEEEKISIRLSVEDSVNYSFSYMRILDVPAGSSLLEVLTEVQRRDPEHFSFETEDTLSGPFLTTVRNLKATQTERTYWQLRKQPSTSLMEGIADYRPEDGDDILLRLAKW